MTQLLATIQQCVHNNFVYCRIFILMYSHLFASQILLRILRFVSWILLLEILSVEILPANAQSITADGTTPTQITETGSQIDISGGTIAGPNQFHSFDQFGVPSGSTANFQAPQPVENVMGRVTGGNPSVIDGTVKVSGAEANLYLMNPAGMVFGKDATLDVPGSFNATSATGIGFEGGGEFRATGSNDYNQLVNSPNSFNFDTETGDIVNHGNLAVPEGKNLNLVGDTVENTGRLSAPGGGVNLIAVPGDKNRVLIQQNGMVLQLDVATENGGVSPSQLPRYLTGGDGHANTLQVDGNGRVRLTRQPKGTAAVIGTPAQPAQITGDRIQVVGEQVIVDQAILQGATQVLLQSTQGNTTILNTQTIVTPSLQDVVGVGSLLQVLGRQNVEIQNSQLQVRRSQGALRVQSGHTPSGAITGAITIATPTGAPLEQVLGNTTLTNTEISVVDAQGNQVVGRVEVLADGTIALVGSLVEGQDIFVGGDFQGGGSLPTAQE
jgi:filamentous hemagglutinin family protein